MLAFYMSECPVQNCIQTIAPSILVESNVLFIAEVYSSGMQIIEPFIRGYQYVLEGNPIALIFTLLSAFQLWRGVKQVGVVRQRWTEFVADPLTRWKQHAAREMAFYVAIPISIFLHELGHAIVVWVLGGSVVAFGYFFFWGFVLPDRTFLPNQEWVLSTAGTWGNLLFAAVVWLWLRGNKSATLRYFAKQTLSSQIVYALIYYPIFTGVFGFGDWRTIYDFSATPLLSGTWAVLHALMLLGYWLLQRRGWFDELAFVDAESAEKYNQLAQDDSLEGRLKRIQIMLDGRAITDGRRLAVETARMFPQSAEAQLLTAVSLSNGEEVSRNAAQHAERALAMGLREPAWQVVANHLVGKFAKRSGKEQEALHALESAIRIAERETPQLSQLPACLYDYALLLRQIGRNEEGKAALERAIMASGGKSAEFYRSERVLFE